MVIELKTNIVYRCTSCYKLRTYEIDVFGARAGAKIKCACGGSHVYICRVKNGYEVCVPCFLCGEEHVFEIPSKILWKSELFTLPCPDSGFDILALGIRESTASWMREYAAMPYSVLPDDFE